MTISPLAASLSGVAAILVVLFMTSRWRSRRESALSRGLPALALAVFLSTGFVGGIQLRQAEHAALRLQMANATAEARSQEAAAPAPAEVRPEAAAASPAVEPPGEPVKPPEQQLALAAPIPDPVPPSATAPPDLSKRSTREVVVYFGTDRARLPGAVPNYGAARGGRLEIGRATVSFPDGQHHDALVHEARHVPSANANDTAPPAAANETLAPADFLLAAADGAPRSQRFEGQALLYVHGMSMSFDAAASAAARIAEALAFDGPVLLYSWPSGSEVASYSYDSASAAEAVSYLREFLDMSREVAPRGLNIVAAGMGGELVLKSLGIVTAASAGFPAGEIVLLAPDMDADGLKTSIGRVKGSVRGVTVYVTGKDRTLEIARRYFGGKPRAGEVAGAQTLVIAGADTIEFPVVEGDRLEAGLDGPLGADLRQLLATGARAGDRLPSQARTSTGGGIYWSYR